MYLVLIKSGKTNIRFTDWVMSYSFIMLSKYRIWDDFDILKYVKKEF